MGALCPCRLCPRRRLRSPPRGRFRQGWGTQKNNLGRAGGGTHGDEGLADAGEQVRPQRVHEQFVLREHGQQQRDGQLGSQTLQQLQEAGTTVGSAAVGDGSPAHPPATGPACTDLDSRAHLPGTYHVSGHQSSQTGART